MSAENRVTAAECEIVTTMRLKNLVDAGETVLLPDVEVPAGLRALYHPADLARLEVAAADNPVVSVEYVGEEEVQCIMIDDEDHLYLTDDMIPTHNTSNIIFLKSTDDSMIDTLQKMSGTRHKTYRSSKTVTSDVGKMTRVGATEGKVSHTYSTEEEPVISYNDLASLSERNSIVFRAGDPPIWNRNETILPMSWRLFKDTIEVPGMDFTLQTIPTLSSALEFDVRLNQPNFAAMLSKRMDQAVKAPTADDIFRKAYGYGDFEVSRLDPDVYALEVMDIVDTMIGRERWMEKAADRAEVEEQRIRDEMEAELPWDDDEEVPRPELPDMGYNLVEDYDAEAQEMMDESIEDEVLAGEVQAGAAQLAEAKVKRYAEGLISRDMLVDQVGRGLPALDKELARVYAECRHRLRADALFSVSPEGHLLDESGTTVFVRELGDAASRDLDEASSAVDGDGRAYSEGGDAMSPASFDELSRYQPTHSFKVWLAKQDRWTHIAEGVFDREMARQMVLSDSVSIED